MVDVGDREATSAPLPLDDAVLRAYLGGVGLGTWLLHRLAPAGVDPLAPEAPLAFVFSPLVGTPLTTSAKFAVVAKSPLTGLLTDALASSRFAIAGKLTGNDAIVVRGRAAELSVLLVDGDGARLEPAPELAGLPAAQAEAAVRERFGRGWQTAAIGPAGERQVRYATVSHDGRHAGRGGLGAVLGAKNIKAVLVRSATRVERRRSRRPCWPRRRTCGHAASARPRRSTASWARWPTCSPSTPSPRCPPATSRPPPSTARPGWPPRSCTSCAGWPATRARPARSAASTSTPARAAARQRMEYENVFALGPLCGVSDPDDVFAASARCDELGLDTISAGGTIAWAMECAERGLIDAPWLRFGDGAALLRALDLIGAREGLGELLAQGSRRAAEIVGQGSIAFAPQVKGMELPGYEPRTLHAMALGLAVNSRGADHNRSGAYEADLSGEHDRLNGGPAHVAAAVGTEDRAAVMDSMILCKFLRGRLRRPVHRVGRAAALGHRLGRRRGRAARHGPADRAGQAGVQPARGRHRRGRHAAAAHAGDAAGAGLRARRRADARTGCGPWSAATTPPAAGTPRAVRSGPTSPGCNSTVSSSTTWPGPGKRLRSPTCSGQLV